MKADASRVGNTRRLLSALVRQVIKVHRALGSCVRKWKYACAYPGVYFGSHVVLENGVVVKASDGGTIEVGKWSSVGRRSTLVAKRGRISIGRRTFIGENAIIVGNQEIMIGDDCLIAERVTIRDQRHGTDVGHVPFHRQQMSSRPILIERNVWLGANVVVLMGVTIGEGSVVGAGSIVNRDLPPHSLAVGVPARIVRSLTPRDVHFIVDPASQ